MTLPDNFDDWEHFQDTVRRIQRRNVLEFFSDVGDESWDPDITTTRGSLRVACMPSDNDTVMQMIARFLFYHITIRRGEEFTEPCYGIPIGTYHETRKFRPQVRLYFKEDLDEVETGYRPLDAQICFRLMNETESTLSKSELTTLANKIKTEFTTNNGYKFKKGKTLLSYNEPEKGYKIQLYAFSATEGKEVIGKVLDIQNHTPDWSKLTINENDMPSNAYPTIPPTKTILGKQRKQPRKRPVGFVRFQYATCAVWGLTKPVALVDRIYRFGDPLVRV